MRLEQLDESKVTCHIYRRKSEYYNCVLYIWGKEGERIRTIYGWFYGFYMLQLFSSSTVDNQQERFVWFFVGH